MDNPDNSIFGTLKGIVETLEQKSGLNPLLFLDAIVCIPSLVGYAVYGREPLLWLASLPILSTLIFYTVAFFIDRNFLRSEKHVKEMRQMDLLGEKGKEVDEALILNQPASSDPLAKKLSQGTKK